MVPFSRQTTTITTKDLLTIHKERCYLSRSTPFRLSRLVLLAQTVNLPHITHDAEFHCPQLALGTTSHARPSHAGRREGGGGLDTRSMIRSCPFMRRINNNYQHHQITQAILSDNDWVCLYTCKRACAFACARVRKFMCICLYVWVCVYTYVYACIYVDMYIGVHIYFHMYM